MLSSAIFVKHSYSWDYKFLSRQRQNDNNKMGTKKSLGIFEIPIFSGLPEYAWHRQILYIPHGAHTHTHNSARWGRFYHYHRRWRGALYYTAILHTIQIANLFLCKQISLQFSCEFLFIQYILFAASVEIKVKCCCFSFFWYSVQFICIIKGIDGCHMLHSPLMYCFWKYAIYEFYVRSAHESNGIWFSNNRLC